MRRLGFLAVLVAAVLASAPGTVAQDRVDFQKQILPLLEGRCFECHSPEYRKRKRTPKAGLRLDGKGYILIGGRNGPVITPGKPEQSKLYTRSTLPPDHEDVMPPSGDVFEKEELALVRRWIAEGADFGSWKGKGGPAKSATKPDTATDPKKSGPSRFAVFEALGKGVPAAPAAAIKAARESGARVEPVFPQSPLLRVEYLVEPGKATDKVLPKILVPLRRHVAILAVGDSKITDRVLGEIAKLPKLVRLDLHGTAVTDRGLKTLVKIPELRNLNLHRTGITDAGLETIAGFGKLTDLFLWDTKVTAGGVAQLAARLPKCKIRHKRVLPSPRRRNADEDGNRRRRRR